MICEYCKWNPATEAYEPLGHAVCIATNEGKEVKSCDCQHRVPGTYRVRVAGGTVLLPGGGGGPVRSEGQNDNELAGRSEPSADRSETVEQAVAGTEVFIGSILEGEIQ